MSIDNIEYGVTQKGIPKVYNLSTQLDISTTAPHRTLTFYLQQSLDEIKSQEKLRYILLSIFLVNWNAVKVKTLRGKAIRVRLFIYVSHHILVYLLLYRKLVDEMINFEKKN